MDMEAWWDVNERLRAPGSPCTDPTAASGAAGIGRLAAPTPHTDRAIPIEADRRQCRWRSSQAAPSRGLIKVNAARFGWA
jgi:hypothetical protein